jgi:HAD superfamily hydrolase (TIGR01484 family)
VGRVGPTGRAALTGRPDFQHLPANIVYYQALATDYDGTLASHGRVDAHTVDALRRLREAGRKIVLVTGREIESLLGTFEHPELLDRVVAENGGVLYEPATQRERLLTDPAPESLALALRDRHIHPLSVGRTIVATVEPHQNEVLDAIRRLGLGYSVIFNKGAVMVLPSGVNKATGLRCALEELEIQFDRAVCVGDAENDNVLLQAGGFGAAVANAIPALKAQADYVTSAPHGAGVAELIDYMLTRDLRGMKRHRRGTPIAVRRLGDGTDVVPDA